MNMDQLKKALGDVSTAQDEKCELIEGAALEACSGGGIPWIKWGMSFSVTQDGTAA
jgi:hypothetical protein